MKKIVLILMLALISVSTTLAFMFKKSNVVENDFQPGKTVCEVQEAFDGVEKTSIKVKNDKEQGSNVESYIRLAMISYWVNESGDIVGKPSEMPDVSYDSAHWLKSTSNDYYYHKSSVAPGETTAELLTGKIILQQVEEDEQILSQVVEVFAESIQAAPADAAAQSWGVTIENNKIIAVP